MVVAGVVADAVVETVWDVEMDVEEGRGVEMDGWVEDMEAEGVAGVEKNFVLAAERAPLMKKSG